MALVDYKHPLHTRLGDCVDTTITEPHWVYQGEWRINNEDPIQTLDDAVRDIKAQIQKHGCTRVNPVVRPTSHWLDVNCLLA